MVSSCSHLQTHSFGSGSEAWDQVEQGGIWPALDRLGMAPQALPARRGGPSKHQPSAVPAFRGAPSCPALWPAAFPQMSHWCQGHSHFPENTDMKQKLRKTRDTYEMGHGSGTRSKELFRTDPFCSELMPPLPQDLSFLFCTITYKNNIQVSSSNWGLTKYTSRRNSLSHFLARK